MIAFDMQIAIMLSIIAVAVGLFNTMIWIRLARKVTDGSVQAKFMYFALVTLLLASGEVVFAIRKSMGLTGGTFEYIQYGFIIAGFTAFLFSARLHLRVSETYGGFSTSAFGRIQARSAKKEATAKQALKDKKPNPGH